MNINASQLFDHSFITPSYKIKLPGKNILVIAPHPDDEIIGCGGTIYKHLKYGDSVSVVYLTNGEKGGKDSLKTGEIRRNEAELVMSKMGIKDYSFLELPDSNISISSQETMALLKIIESVNPDLICLPHLNDRHRDHFASNILVSEVIQQTSLDILIAGYEVWAPLEANTLINVTEFLDSKKEMMGIYQSQLQLFDYFNLIENTGKYRNILHRSKRSKPIAANEAEELRTLGIVPCEEWNYLEAFVVMNGVDYSNLVQKKINMFMVR